MVEETGTMANRNSLMPQQLQPYDSNITVIEETSKMTNRNSLMPQELQPYDSNLTAVEASTMANRGSLMPQGLQSYDSDSSTTVTYRNSLMAQELQPYDSNITVIEEDDMINNRDGLLQLYDGQTSATASNFDSITKDYTPSVDFNRQFPDVKPAKLKRYKITEDDELEARFHNNIKHVLNRKSVEDDGYDDIKEIVNEQGNEELLCSDDIDGNLPVFHVKKLRSSLYP